MVELLIVIVIGALLAVVAIPSMRQVLNTMRQSSALGLLVNDLNQARGEAIKLNQRALMCARSNTATDATTCGTDWTRGWLVCVEAVVPDTCVALPTAQIPNPIVVVRPPLDGNLTLVGSAAVIRFNPNSTQGAGGAATLTLSGTWDSPTPRVVTVAATGSITK